MLLRINTMTNQFLHPPKSADSPQLYPLMASGEDLKLSMASTLLSMRGVRTDGTETQVSRRQEAAANRTAGLGDSKQLNTVSNSFRDVSVIRLVITVPSLMIKFFGFS